LDALERLGGYIQAALGGLGGAGVETPADSASGLVPGRRVWIKTFFAEYWN
jgi:hypothetical protein